MAAGRLPCPLIDQDVAGAALVTRIERTAPGVVRLAELASLARHVEPGLLRELRLTLADDLDSGVEADLWFSPFVGSRAADGFVLRPEVAEILQRRLAVQPARRDAAREIIERRHRDTNPAQELEERIAYLALRPDSETAIDDELRTALKALVAETDRTKDIARWAVRAVPRLPNRVRESSAAWTLALAAGAYLDGRSVIRGSAPNGALDDLQALLPDRPGVRVGVRAVVGGVELSYPADSRGESILTAATDPVLVEVSVIAEGPRTVSLKRGTVEYVDDVDPAEFSVRAADGSGLSLHVPEPDLTLRIGEDLNRARSQTAPYPDEHDVSVGPVEYREIQGRVRDWVSRSPSVSEVMDVGLLIGRLVPESFWKSLDRLTNQQPDRAPTVLLVTDLGDVPWELATSREGRSSVAYPTLGMRVDLTTWLAPAGSRRPFPDPLPFASQIGTLAVAAAGRAEANISQSEATPLPYSAGEAQMLVERFGAVAIPATTESLWPWLEGDYPADGLHVAGHGMADPDGSGVNVLLDDGRNLNAQMDIAVDLNASFVFLNASFAADPGLIGRLLQGGAGAVIAPRWGVDDRLSHDLASEFYGRALGDGLPLARALREARVVIADRSNADATAFAYACFAHPATQLQRRPSAVVWDLAGRKPRGRSLVGHRDPVTAVAIAADGRSVASAGADDTLREWDPQTARQTDERGPTGLVRAIAYAPDGSRIATVGESGNAKLWISGRSDPVIISLSSGGMLVDAAWSPDGQTLAIVAEDGVLTTTDRDGTPQGSRALRGFISQLAWTSAKRVAVGRDDGTVDIVGSVTGAIAAALQADRDAITALVASPDGARLAAASDKGTIRVWDPQGGLELAAIDVGAPVIAMSFTGPDRLRGVMASGRVIEWSLGASGTQEVAHLAPTGIAVFGPDGTALVTFGSAILRQPAGVRA